MNENLQGALVRLKQMQRDLAEVRAACESEVNAVPEVKHAEPLPVALADAPVLLDLGTLTEMKLLLTLSPPSPQLQGLGYGFFDRIADSNKPPMMNLAFSIADGEGMDTDEQRREFCKLLERFEPKVVELAASIARYGQLQPILVRTNHEIVIGQRRVLAIAYNAIVQGKRPKYVTVVANVRDLSDEETINLIASESVNSKRVNPMVEARFYSMLRDRGMKVVELAQTTGVDHQVIRQRLELLKLPKGMQEKVEDGELGVVKALKLVKTRLS